MMSSGGITTVETASRQPIRLVESGPAGGAILARNIAAQNGLEKVLSFDMGGTTAKITLIDDCEPLLSRAFEVARAYRFLKGSGLPLRIPVIEMVKSGPVVGRWRRSTHCVKSRSARKVPALIQSCLLRTEAMQAATVTDADVVMGRIDPAGFAGGKIALFPERAVAAIKAEIADTLEISNDVAAAGVDEIVNENMANAARVHAIEHGKDTADRTLVAFGGAAPLHAARLADKLGIDRVIVPRGAGVGSAVGFLMAPIAYEVVRTASSTCGSSTPNTSTESSKTCAAKPKRWCDSALLMPNWLKHGPPTCGIAARGTKSSPVAPFAPDDAALLQKLFDTAYAAHFDPDNPEPQCRSLDLELNAGDGASTASRGASD